MSDRLHVSTRKGLFTVERGSSGDWQIADVAFLGMPVSLSLTDQRDGCQYAAITLGHFGTHLHRRRQGGSWEEVAAPSFPKGAVVPERMPDPTAPPAKVAPTKPAALSEIWALETAGDKQPGTLWCGAIPGALFRSDDHGDSWQLNQPFWDLEGRMMWFGGGKDDSGVHSICVDPRDPNHVMAAISCGGVWGTQDGGQSWRSLCEGLRAEYVPPEQAGEPNYQDPHRVVACPGVPDAWWMQHHNGIFRTTNSGQQWQEITNAQPSAFGFAVAVHPTRPDTAWFVPAVKDETRVPVDAKVVVSRTTDGGKSFDILSQGLPRDHAYDIVYRHAFEVDTTGYRLAMGSTTGGLWVSEDAGDSWRTVAANLPPIYAVRFA